MINWESLDFKIAKILKFLKSHIFRRLSFCTDAPLSASQIIMYLYGISEIFRFSHLTRQNYAN